MLAEWEPRCIVAPQTQLSYGTATDSIRSVLEYRREEASAHASQLVEQTVIELP